MNPGSIVTCRNRDWVLLPNEDPNLLLLRPLTGATDEVVAVHKDLPAKPYRWGEARRALLRAKLEAWFARAYGLTRDELRYILDPADVHGPDFPGETFRVLKEKETAKFGEYRTRRLVLEAWDRLT